jgi:hypothetical protein
MKLFAVLLVYNCSVSATSFMLRTILSWFITPCRKIGGALCILGGWVFSAWAVMGGSFV